MARTELPDKIETERLVLRVRTVADAEDIFDYASLPEVAYPAGYGIVVKGTDKSLALSISTIAMKMMCWKSTIPYTQTIGGEVMCQKLRVP